MTDRPAPFVPPDLDVRDLPIPREAFAQMAAAQFGISIEEARAHTDRVADAMEAEQAHRRRK